MNMNEKNEEVAGLTLYSLMEQAQSREAGVPYEGWAKDDLNIPGNILVVHTAGSVYSFPRRDVLHQEQLEASRVRVWIRRGSKAMFMRGFVVGSEEKFTVGMEDIAPPAPIFDPDGPQQAQLQEPLNLEALTATLAGAISAYSGRCAGGDSYDNNCAHFLSDAFIRAGFSELAGNNPHINARCNTSAHRPIRARDMWSWFQSKARRTSRTVQRNTGNWAIFQLNERVYWGGHVVLLDSNRWLHFGTGWYGNWDQYLYQW